MKRFVSILVFVFSLFIVSQVSAAESLVSKNADWWKEATPEVVEQMIKNGADVNARDRFGFTPLLFAIRDNKNLAVVKMLLEHGADVNSKTDHDLTALMMAVSLNDDIDINIISTLIAKGADVNARNEVGQTALMLAAMHNENPEIIETLINYGANVKYKDKDGKTALDYSEKNPKLYKTNAFWHLNDLTYR